MIKEIFDNSSERLREIIYKKLAEKERTQEEIDSVARELAMMKKWGDEKRFLCLYELAKYMKEKGIYFNARGLFYTSFYCSYLLGILEYNPLKFNLSYQGYLDGSNAVEFDVEEDSFEAVVGFLSGEFGEGNFHRTTYHSERKNKTGISICTYLLSKGMPPLERTEIEGVTALTVPRQRGPKEGDYLAISLLRHPALDFIKRVELEKGGEIDYRNFQDESVFEYVRENPFSHFGFDKKEIALKQPSDLRALADCKYKIISMTERNLADRISYAVLYYKLAYIEMKFSMRLNF